MPEAVIVSAVRTPIGRANKGSLKDIRADDLAAIALRGAVERVPNIKLDALEDVIVGCAFPEGEQGMNVARIAAALAGFPIGAGGTTVNRFCASSLQAFNFAAQGILTGNGDPLRRRRRRGHVARPDGRLQSQPEPQAQGQRAGDR